MILIYELHPERVKLNHYVSNHFVQKLLSGQTDKNTTDRLLYTATKMVGKNTQKLKHLTNGSRRRQTSPPVPPPGELYKTYASYSTLAYSLHYIKT